jgi:class 3 adenylate cyclase
MELRLFMEDLCCDLCRFQHLAEGLPPEHIRIRQDFDLGLPGAFADIRVTIPDARPYFVEVKWAQDCEEVVERVAAKYSTLTPATRDAAKVIVVSGAPECEGGRLASMLRSEVDPSLEIEVWDTPRLRELLRKHFQTEVANFEREELLKVRAALERIKGIYAFGETYSHSPEEAALKWHFGCWTINRARKQPGYSEASVFRTGQYTDVATLMVDLSGFSSYVRDTRDQGVVQQVLTSFYTKSRRAVIDSGGMLYQFVGDAVIGVFGLPTVWPGYLDAAIDSAAAIMDIGRSVSNKWQRLTDRIQPVAGCHTGVALGDLLIVPLRSYSRSHLGLVADSVNMAARLSTAAKPGEMVVSNALFQGLRTSTRRRFTQMEPIEAKNVGLLQAWKWNCGAGSPQPAATSAGNP